MPPSSQSTPGRDCPPQRHPPQSPPRGRAEPRSPLRPSPAPQGRILRAQRRGRAPPGCPHTTGTRLPTVTPSCWATLSPRHPHPAGGPVPVMLTAAGPGLCHRRRGKPQPPGGLSPFPRTGNAVPSGDPPPSRAPPGPPPPTGKGTRLWPRGLQPLPGHHPAPCVVTHCRLGTLRLEMMALTPHCLQLHQAPPSPLCPPSAPPRDELSCWGVYKYFIAAVLGCEGPRGATVAPRWGCELVTGTARGSRGAQRVPGCATPPRWRGLTGPAPAAAASSGSGTGASAHPRPCGPGMEGTLVGTSQWTSGSLGAGGPRIQPLAASHAQVGTSAWLDTVPVSPVPPSHAPSSPALRRAGGSGTASPPCCAASRSPARARVGLSTGRGLWEPSAHQAMATSPQYPPPASPPAPGPWPGARQRRGATAAVPGARGGCSGLPSA